MGTFLIIHRVRDPLSIVFVPKQVIVYNLLFWDLLNYTCVTWQLSTNWEDQKLCLRGKFQNIVVPIRLSWRKSTKIRNLGYEKGLPKQLKPEKSSDVSHIMWPRILDVSVPSINSQLVNLTHYSPLRLT